MSDISSMPRDANRVPIWTNGIITAKVMTLAGGTANDPGDYDGTGNPATLFTVTGEVVVRLVGYCSVDLAGASAKIEVGIAGNTAALIAQTTATDIDAGTVWVDTAPATVEAFPAAQVLVGGTDIIQTVGTANITAGKITYYCAWSPLSADGGVVAA